MLSGVVLVILTSRLLRNMLNSPFVIQSAALPSGGYVVWSGQLKNVHMEAA